MNRTRGPAWRLPKVSSLKRRTGGSAFFRLALAFGMTQLLLGSNQRVARGEKCLFPGV